MSAEYTDKEVKNLYKKIIQKLSKKTLEIISSKDSYFNSLYYSRDCLFFKSSNQKLLSKNKEEVIENINILDFSNLNILKEFITEEKYNHFLVFFENNKQKYKYDFSVLNNLKEIKNIEFVVKFNIYSLVMDLIEEDFIKPHLIRAKSKLDKNKSLILFDELNSKIARIFSNYLFVDEISFELSLGTTIEIGSYSWSNNLKHICVKQSEKNLNKYLEALTYFISNNSNEFKILLNEDKALHYVVLTKENYKEVLSELFSNHKLLNVKNSLEKNLSNDIKTKKMKI